jgi:thymidylate synthase
MEKIRSVCIGGMWKQLVGLVANEGIPVRSRMQETLELEDIFIEYPEVRSYVFKNPIRNINPVFHLVELMYFLCGRNDADALTKYMSKMEEYTDDLLNIFEGSYGPSIYEALPYALAQLKHDKMSRRAVIPILRQSHIVHLDSLDIPCNLSLGMRIRAGKLNFSVTTRSQDLFRGFIYDTLEFQLLQFMLAKFLDVGIGSYSHHMYSLHLYTKDLTTARTAAEFQKEEFSERPSMTFSNIFPYAQKIMNNAEFFCEPDEDDDVANAIVAFRSRSRSENIGIYTEWANEWLSERKK